MRFILFLCFLVCCTATPLTKLNHAKAQTERLLSDALLAKLEEFRLVMRKGNPAKGIPILDPFKLSTITFGVNTSLLSFNTQAGGIDLKGLSDFQVTKVDLTLIPPGMKFDFNLPMTILKTDTYKMNGLIFNALPIYGEGRSYFEIKNFKVSGYAKASIKGSLVQIKELELDLNLGSLLSETTGMLGGGDIDNVVNAILGELAHDFFNANSKAISKVVTDRALGKINSLLLDIPLQDIIDIITGGK